MLSFDYFPERKHIFLPQKWTEKKVEGKIFFETPIVCSFDLHQDLPLGSEQVEVWIFHPLASVEQVICTYEDAQNKVWALTSRTAAPLLWIADGSGNHWALSQEALLAYRPVDLLHSSSLQYDGGQAYDVRLETTTFQALQQLFAQAFGKAELLKNREKNQALLLHFDYQHNEKIQKTLPCDASEWQSLSSFLRSLAQN